MTTSNSNRPAINWHRIITNTSILNGLVEPQFTHDATQEETYELLPSGD